MPRTNETSQVSDYIFESILLQSERLNTDVELREVTTDLDIFEHLDKPYLTAKILLLDNENLFENADILGAEKISIKIRSMRKDTKPISKTFYITHVVSTEKTGDNIQTMALQLIEDIGYISNLINVNRFYKGKVSKIIKDISEEFLDKGILSASIAKQDINLIVPNLNPIETLKWITSRVTSKRGYPFYIYSSLVKDKLLFNDLGTMLQENVINPDISYQVSSMAAQSSDPDIKRRIIRSHTFGNNIENLYKIIRKGLIGSKYEYIDTINDKQKSFDFDIKKDLYDILASDSVLQQNQANPAFSEEYKINNKSFNKLQNRKIVQVGGSGSYKLEDGESYKNSYREEKLASEYKLEIISRAMDNVLKKNPLTMVIDGVDFIDGDKHSTIGNNLRAEFLSSDPELGAGERKIDAKKSGDYLIYAARHMFKKEQYDLSLTCVKIGNYKR